MTRAPRSPSAAHFDRPADAAAHIAALSAVVVASTDPQHAAQFAVSIARAASAHRRVAIADLAGDLRAVYALAGGEDAPGLTECFRDGLTLSEIARPVPDNDALFVLPSGANVRFERAILDPERWTRLIRGFGEAGGLLIAVSSDSAPVLRTLGDAGAQLLYAGSAAAAPTGIPLAATVGAVLAPPAPRRTPGTVPGWAVAAAAIVVIAVAGAAGVAWVGATNAADGGVVLEPSRRVDAPPPTADAAGAPLPAPDTVSLIEQLSPDDSARAAEFAVEVIAANTASNANSLLADLLDGASRPAATISVILVRSGAGRAARWHKVMFGAWQEARSADSALRALRNDGAVRRDGGAVVRAPFAVLLVDGAAPERARAVMDVWRAKGVTPYALVQDDGTTRVYTGAFETVAQAVAMAAMVKEAGGSPIVAYRTGRPD